MQYRKKWHLAIGLSVALLFLFLTVQQVSVGEIGNVLAMADRAWLGAGFIAIAVGYACRIERWRIMLLSANSGLRWSTCAGPLLASFAANNLLPFRAGDVFRSFAFNAQLGTSTGVVVATLFVERLLDLLIILVMFGAALAIFGFEVANLAGISVIALLALAAVLAIVSFPTIVAPATLAASRCIARWLPRLGSRIVAEVDKSIDTLSNLAGGGRMIVLVAWSAAAWLAEGCAFVFVALSFPSITRPLAGLLALPVGALATLVPSTPGYVGTFDFFTARAMTALGNEVGVSTAYAFSIHAAVWLLPTVTGGLYLLLRSARGERSKALEN